MWRIGTSTEKDWDESVTPGQIVVFQATDLHCRSPKSGGLRFKSRGLKKGDLMQVGTPEDKDLEDRRLP